MCINTNLDFDMPFPFSFSFTIMMIIKKYEFEVRGGEGAINVQPPPSGPCEIYGFQGCSGLSGW